MAPVDMLYKEHTVQERHELLAIVEEACKRMHNILQYAIPCVDDGDGDGDDNGHICQD